MDPNLTVKYLMADPSVPELVKETILPDPAQASFHIIGYAGGGHDPNSSAGQAANVYVAVANALRDVNTATEKPINRWSFTDNLTIVPRAGVMLNAYYNRQTLSFFYGADASGNTIFTANSPKIVCHELGHAVLDFYRPDLWNAASLEIWAFHEFFGDFTASMAVMLHDEVLEYALKQTNGTLEGPNVIANIGEQLAATLFGLNLKQTPGWLRTAANKFVYAPINFLPQEGPDNVVIAEPHSLSRVMTGAIYDILLMMYRNYLAEGRSQILALRAARETLGKYVLKAILTTPTTAQFFEGFARTLLYVDFNEGNRFQTQIYDIFISRRILNGQFRLMAEHDRTVHDCKKVKLIDHFPLRTQSYNPLYEAEIEVPHDDPKSIVAAQHMIGYLHRNGKVSDSHETPFQISDGKLVRSHFMCGCNRPSKFQPEFLKPYKPQNHAGCCCGSPKKTPVEAPPVVKKGCYIRYQTPR